MEDFMKGIKDAITVVIFMVAFGWGPSIDSFIKDMTTFHVDVTLDNPPGPPRAR